MQILFESYPKEVRSENRYLLSALGSEYGHPRYQWAWAADLMMPMVLMDEKSQFIYDYHCACGINASVHSATCQFTLPRKRWEMRNIAFNMTNAWVFVTWRPPECTKDDWESEFGSVPYPEGGYFIPVSSRTNCVHIPGGAIPLRETSQACVASIRQHAKKSAKQHTQDIADGWAQEKKDRRANRIIEFKDAFPVHEGFAGKKENWSHGGTGESPVLNKGEICLLP